MAKPGIALQLPLSKAGRLYGDISVEVSPQGRIAYSRQSLIEQMAPLLTKSGAQKFEAALPSASYLTTEEVAQAGVNLRYDSALLEVVVERVEPTISALELVGGEDNGGEVPISAQPEDFSAYLNIIGDLRLTDFRNFEDPAALFLGAVRYHGFVAEFDGGYDRRLAEGSGLYRRRARLLYDQVDKLRRFSAGDLQLNGIPLVAGALLGGIAIEKGRRVFTGLAPLAPSGGGQQILLNRDATVDVLVDGQQVETFQLGAGAYDLSQLRARYGAANAQLYITDITGRRQLTSVDPFFDPAELLAGEDEYSAAIGFIPTSFANQPTYSRDPGFAGFYRRGITNRLILGGALQLSRDVQVAGADFILSPRAIPGRFAGSAAFSTGNSRGIAVRGGYSVEWGYGPRARQFSVTADYRSGGFRTINEFLDVDQFSSWNVNANFAQRLGEKTSLVSGLSLFKRAGLKATRLAFVDIIRRTRRFRITAGAEYGTGVFERNFGVRLGIAMPFGQRSRAEATYNSRRDDFRAFLTRGFEEQVGSIGYDIGVRRSAGNVGIDGTADYIGNRFFARGSIATSGQGFSNFASSKDARLQLGTSIAFAGGDFAIGRPITDSFVIAKAHPSLGDEQVVLARSVGDRRYLATSGPLGPALGGRLNSYTRQTIIYDLRDGAKGYDIGDGIETVQPPYRSGYHLIVGTDAIVTAYGYLNLGSQRANLVAGSITSADDADFGTQPFFTNSVGRFAVMALRPGKSYEVRLFKPPVSFTVKVPEDSPSLLQMNEVTINASPDNGQESR